LLIRSAKRSIPAAKAATAEGYTAYNISFGFMGVLDKATGEQQHLTPHTSHLTPHTSHLTPHTSHLTPHTSHLSQVSITEAGFLIPRCLGDRILFDFISCHASHSKFVACCPHMNATAFN
jgi:hypothetical protein